MPPRPRAAVRLEVTRAVPIFIHEGKEAPNEVATTAATVGEAIAQAGIELKPDDLLTPGPETPASAGLHVYVRHSVGLEIQADGERRSVRTLHTKVWQLLTQEGLTLGPLDILEPGLDAELTEGMLVRIVRVREELEEEQEVIPFAKQLVPDAEIEIDTRRIIQEGSDGLLRSTWLVRYEDNVEVARAEQKEWMENETQDEITGYGTKIVLRDLETPEGTVTYWRKLQVYATWYEPGSCGKSKDDPGYGWTATGVRLQHGIIATDPSVFPMGTRMYVPGYGLGVAADTGGAIVGYIIDLGFAEDEPRTWGSSYVEIYLLTPVPDEIIYLLP